MSQGIIRTIIPHNIEDITERLDNEGSDNYRLTLLSGITISSNLLISRGKDSSGIISTLLEKL